ncbi:hypothetical protein A2276_01265 [candidate division WOR-1 bacterium RIFOXYA12_FULL_43_27]|uniref:Uncharacterized protein n=1 Tax=candidate division WOR-1 bacterium RIFOXYC2_FULL_46_14 TaxID=1802587 RepID=A0A1F4U6Q8_UNCSA|nr:MAG: hypothetical protein A2276_01265 [candidate division WOR-1 bacterium RIFOXYA12_FULL_43_27]OGC20685.1 MAG: hypothetical protein A2292_06610 [candidate division WOR-1 bacterium RIFOXYB2_FULL_46_45]OGC31578.1 MAG: hypothetical protein A2232_04840 [candidate division WOR-1 bacterium RIFOXYA2_FULL_46_56]OGC39983.1 MAG: hypothetical protein A2438_05685 [candidate division WOR-1 bacterium RIFOXYC2_FULL_46_14]
MSCYVNGNDIKGILAICDRLNYAVWFKRNNPQKALEGPSVKEKLSGRLKKELDNAQKNGENIGEFIGRLLISLSAQDRETLRLDFGIEGELTYQTIIDKILSVPEDDSDLKKAEEKIGGECRSFWGELARRVHLGGSFRLRYQGEKRETEEDPYHRFRYKIDFGIGVDLIEDYLRINLGMITGDSPRSPNNTAGGDQSFGLDRANLEFTPIPEILISGGRIAFPLYLSSDLAIDKDLSWDGLSAKIDYPVLGGNLSVFFSAAVLLLRASKDNPALLFPFQLGFKGKIEGFDYRVGAGPFIFSGIEGGPVFENRSKYKENTTEKQEKYDGYKYGYDAFTADWEIGYADLFRLPVKHRIAHFGEIIKSFNSSQNTLGFLLGAKLELFDRRLNFEYGYRKLQRDAVPDIFPDSDFYFGGTGVLGHRVKIKGTYYKNKYVSVCAGAAYFRADRTENGDPQDLWQIDFAEAKFSY